MFACHSSAAIRCNGRGIRERLVIIANELRNRFQRILRLQATLVVASCKVLRGRASKFDFVETFDWEGNGESMRWFESFRHKSDHTAAICSATQVSTRGFGDKARQMAVHSGAHFFA